MGLDCSRTIIFPFVLVMLYVSSSFSSSSYSSEEQKNIYTCDCNHCNENKGTIDPGEKEMTTIVPDGKTSEKESNSWNGDETICARDRDYEDKTFSSLCHMFCYNKCTRFRVTSLKLKNTTRFINAVRRSNYYKLKDGPC